MSKTLAGYPLTGALGARSVSVRNHTGPASYTQVGVATPPTGGDSAKAVPFGFKSIDALYGSISDDGQFYVIPIFPIAPASPGSGSVASVALMWVIAATGAQVAGAVDLSGRTVRLTAIGF